ncbi:hypothetical protein AHAS_AhasUnG0105900 [Arachis hypogaea]
MGAVLWISFGAGPHIERCRYAGFQLDQIKSFARSKTRKQTYKRPEKGLYCSPLFDMFIQYQYKLKLHQSGKAPIEARSNL